MKVFFQTLLPKAGRAEAPDARPGGAKAEEKALAASAIPQTPGASGKSAPPVRGKDDAAGGRPSLALEAGDFIDRVPHHLLRFGNFDLHRPLLFDMAEVADRIARGIFTIPLADLLKAIPEMFADDAQALHALEIRFPWQRVMEMVNESAASQKDSGGETLAQKLRRMRKTNKPAPRDGNSQSKRGAGRDGENAWFSKRAITFEGTNGRGDASQEKAASVHRAAAPGLPEVPESAPALFELPESKGPNVSQGAPPPSPPPVERAAVSPAPNRGPICDLMDLGAEPSLLAHSGTSGADSENGAPVPSSAAGAAKSGVGESEQKMTRTRIAFLEAQLKTLSSKHQNEISILKAEADRRVEKMRGETEKERLELMAQFQFERQQFTVAKDEQLARTEAEYRAGVAAQQNQISELRAVGDKASDGERQISVADFESRLAELKALEARLEPLIAELESVKSERDQVAALLVQEEQRGAALAARLEFDLFALRVESAQIVAEERERANQKIAGLEFERQQVTAERQQLLREMSARGETSVVKRDEELARLRDELEKAGALAAAQAAAHERVATQWEEDVQTYRKRIQAVLGEKTALAAKLREAEIAFQAAGRSVVETAA